MPVGVIFVQNLKLRRLGKSVQPNRQKTWSKLTTTKTIIVWNMFKANNQDTRVICE